MDNRYSWKEAIDYVLAESGRPMHYTDIASEILERGLREKPGATPDATVNATITESIKRDGRDSKYIRIDRGQYALRQNHGGAVYSSECEINNIEPVEEEQCNLLTSFGMYWNRSSVNWTTNPEIWGKRRIEAEPVNFNTQCGVYLLYDGREVIYVGRSTDRPLGTRLYEHTKDRLSSRWDRFSWFGLLPVSENGTLGTIPQQYSSETMISALEAMLIEAVEPRQNRRRGDDLTAVEYIQHEDPEIARKRIRESLVTAMDRL